MTTTRRTLWTLLFILPCSVVAAQSTPKETFETRPEPQTQELKAEAAQPPNVHIKRLRHASAKELELSLGKIFEAQIKAGQLAIIADVRSNRLIIRSGDELCVRVNQLVEELDIESLDNSPSSDALPGQSRTAKSYVAPQSTIEQEAYWRILQDTTTTANDRLKVQSLRESLTSTVERDFAVQQQELRSELNQLRAKMASLESLLEKRDAQKTQICQKRVESLLSGKVPSGVQSVTQGPLFGGSADKLQTLNETTAIIDAPTTEAVKTSAFEQPKFKSHRLLGSDPAATMDVLQSMFAGRVNMKLSIDPKTNNILALATEEDHKRIDDIVSEMSPSKTRRGTPLDSNARISADNIAEDITTILQAELIGDESMQVILKGKPTTMANSMLFQLDNRTGQVEYELLLGNEKRMTVRVKLECHGAGQPFWERIFGDNIRLSITQDDVERVTSGQLITKSVYLPKESGKGQATLISYEMEAGTDVREAAKQFGLPIVTMTLSRRVDRSTTKNGTQEWQHSYGGSYGGSKEVQAYYLDLVEYCKLRAKLGPQDQKAKAVLNKLISNAATNNAIHQWANPHRTELLKHVAAQKALSAINDVDSKEIGLLVNALSKLETSGRVELEKTLQSEQDSNP